MIEFVSIVVALMPSTRFLVKSQALHELLPRCSAGQSTVHVDPCGNVQPCTISTNGNHNISDGQRVLTGPLAKTPLRRGDVVYLRRHDGRQVLHRVMRILANGQIQTRGDAHWRLDDKVDAKDVLGQMQQTPAATGLQRLRHCLRNWRLLAESWCVYRYRYWTAGRHSVAPERARQSSPGKL
jgi:hypothetical protein